MSSEEKQELMQKNILKLLKDVFQLLVFKYWTQTAALSVAVVACIVFVTNAKGTIKELPLVKAATEKTAEDLKQFKRDVAIDRATDQSSVKDIARDVQIALVKLDDLKRNGRGEYNEETMDTIRLIKRHRK